jgi:hypothetical protein
MNLVACVVVVGFATFLFGLTAVVFAKPALAERFFRGFASSARTHVTEQALRLLLGAALVVRSPEMWRPGVFLAIGWTLVVSSAALLILPWRWHHKLGVRVLPMVVRHMKLYAVGMFIFGALLLYGLFVPLLPPHGGWSLNSPTRRQHVCLSRSVLTHSPRQAHVWLIFDVRRSEC